MTDKIANDEIDLVELFLKVLRGWRVVVFVFTGAVFVSVVYAFFIVAPKYRAEARVWGVPAVFCPDGFSCQLTLNETMEVAAQFVSTAEGLSEIEAALRLSNDGGGIEWSELPSEERRRRLIGSSDIEVEDTTVSIVVQTNSASLSVELADAIASVIAVKINSLSLDNFIEAESSLRFWLNELGTVSGEVHSVDITTQLSLLASSISTQLQFLERHLADDFEPVLVLPAASSFDLTAQRRPFLIALGASLGIFFGVAASVLIGVGRGKINSERAVISAFHGGEAIVGRRKEIVSTLQHKIWQEVRVALGDLDAGVIVMIGIASREAALHSAISLACEISRSDFLVSVVDGATCLQENAVRAEDVFNDLVPDNCVDVRLHRCTPNELYDLTMELSKLGEVVIALPPSPEVDLPAVSCAISTAMRHIFLVERGEVSQIQVKRLLLAERDYQRKRVLVVI